MTSPRLTVARIGKAHGLRGEVALEVRTDIPEERFADGAVLSTEPAERGPLTVLRSRVSSGRWYVQLDGVTDREGAEALRGTALVVDAVDSEEEDAWYVHELAGLRAELADGSVVGVVKGLEHLPAHDALVIEETSGVRTLVPFVTAIVPTVDVPGGRVVLTPPGGLLASDAANLDVALPDPHDAADDAAGSDAEGRD